MRSRPNVLGLAVFGVILIVGAFYLAGCFSEHPPAAPSAGSDSGAGSAIVHADDSTFEQVVLRSSEPVLVDFYADWCGPCQRLAPVLEEVAREVPGARIVKVNVDHSPGLASRYGIRAIPNLIVFRNGEVTDQTKGLVDKPRLRAMLGR